jgi:hypothetical protein
VRAHYVCFVAVAVSAAWALDLAQVQHSCW